MKKYRWQLATEEIMKDSKLIDFNWYCTQPNVEGNLKMVIVRWRSLEQKSNELQPLDACESFKVGQEQYSSQASCIRKRIHPSHKLRAELDHTSCSARASTEVVTVTPRNAMNKMAAATFRDAMTPQGIYLVVNAKMYTPLVLLTTIVTIKSSIVTWEAWQARVNIYKTTTSRSDTKWQKACVAPITV